KEKRQAVISHAVTKGLDPTAPMKDSGVEWLGEVPAHWEVKRLRYLLKANGLIRGPFGGDLKKEIFVERGVKVYEQKNAIYRDFSLGNSFITQDKFSEMRRFEVKAGDYIMSCSGTIGRAYRIPEEAPVGIINQALLVIRFSEELGFEFADWIFVADFFANQIIDNSQGGAMKNLVGMDVFTSISMPVPSVQEQLSIAKYLRDEVSRIDALISAAGQAVNLMQERRSALISAAVTGKIDVRGWQPPAHTQAPEPAVAEAV
ncbi:MAG: restriction endonuclease subunit S, partial [Pseudoalteromonas distincta]